MTRQKWPLPWFLLLRTGLIIVGCAPSAPYALVELAALTDPVERKRKYEGWWRPCTRRARR
jgi:hypothetical protein